MAPLPYTAREIILDMATKPHFSPQHPSLNQALNPKTSRGGVLFNDFTTQEWSTQNLCLTKSPSSCPDFESRTTRRFRLRIVRESLDKPGKSLRHPSPNYALISLSRPLSLPDRKYSRQKGGCVSKHLATHECPGEEHQANRSPILLRSLMGTCEPV